MGHTVYFIFISFCNYLLTTNVDIIGLLITGVILLILFIFWQRYLERVHDAIEGGADPSEFNHRWTPPPLMKISLWGRANGKLAVIMVVAFLVWSSFLALHFILQVRAIFLNLWSDVVYSPFTNSYTIKTICT